MKEQDRTTMVCPFNVLVLLVVVSFINADERGILKNFTIFRISQVENYDLKYSRE